MGCTAATSIQTASLSWRSIGRDCHVERSRDISHCYNWRFLDFARNENLMLPPFSIVIPCFNEEGRISETLRVKIEYLATNAPKSELIVVNDGSTDGTGAIARKILSETNIATRLLENFPNRGKGAAVRSGLLAAREPIGLFSDADLSTPIEETPKIIEPIANGEVDIAFGSRAMDRSLIGIHQPWRREQAGRVFNLLVRH